MPNKRLTNYSTILKKYVRDFSNASVIDEMTQMVGKIEDIEEELHIDAIAFLNLLKKEKKDGNTSKS